MNAEFPRRDLARLYAQAQADREGRRWCTYPEGAKWHAAPWGPAPLGVEPVDPVRRVECVVREPGTERILAAVDRVPAGFEVRDAQGRVLSRTPDLPVARRRAEAFADSLLEQEDAAVRDGDPEAFDEFTGPMGGGR